MQGGDLLSFLESALDVDHGVTLALDCPEVELAVIISTEQQRKRVCSVLALADSVLVAVKSKRTTKYEVP